jgi:hypothetical protein
VAGKPGGYAVDRDRERRVVMPSSFVDVNSPRFEELPRGYVPFPEFMKEGFE